MTEQLVATSPEVIADEAIREMLDKFRKAHAEATARLDEPMLSIAMIGTTSSGKSTIVNALTGRRIAPIEAGEMSGGVLVLRESSKRTLVVEGDEHSPWEYGEWRGLTDEATYDKVRDGVMKPYHAARRDRWCEAPRVLTEGPLLPARDATLLGLSEHVGVEFIDLPGLKSVQDHDNLKVIQSRVHKSVNLVALDYMQSDENQRKKLLEELRRTVEFLGGRTTSMIFILNRVDQRGDDDEPLPARIKLLQEEIQHVLGLDEIPVVIPFEARLLYRAQCAWGPSSEDAPSADSSHRIQHMQALFKECAATLEVHAEADEELEDWLLSLKRKSRKGQEVPVEDLRRLVLLAQEWSGGSNLWACLKEKVEESFAELIIAPILSALLDSHTAMIGQISNISNIKQIDSKKELEESRQQLAKLQRTLKTEVEQQHRRFRDLVSVQIETLMSGSIDALANIPEQPGFEKLAGANSEIKSALLNEIVEPLSDAAALQISALELEERLQKVLEPYEAKELARAVDRLTSLLQHHVLVDGSYEIRARVSNPRDDSALESLESVEEALLQLNVSVGEALINRTKYLLVATCESLDSGLKEFVRPYSEAVLEALRDRLPGVEFKNIFDSAHRAIQQMEFDSLDPRTFEVGIGPEIENVNVTEKVGTKAYQEEYVDGDYAAEGGVGGAGVGAAIGGLLGGPLGALLGATLGVVAGGGGGAQVKVKKTKTTVRDVMGEVAYQRFMCPGPDEMAEIWAAGVVGAESRIWKLLEDWTISSLRQSSEELTNTISAALSLADRTIQLQLDQKREDYTEIVASWKMIDSEVRRLEVAATQLYQVIATEHP